MHYKIKTTMTDPSLINKNPLLCDIETGICEVSDTKPDPSHGNIVSGSKLIKITYFTDPICSSCWGIEPQLRKLKLEYGHIIEIEYRMGGLLPDWSYNSGGISKPSDVAKHWDEVSVYYDMPIDGDLWLEDPLSSSFPPSIAFKAAEIQNKEKAVYFLRELRELMFLKKKNITKWEYVEESARKVNLDPSQLKDDTQGKAVELFEEDLKLANKLGVRGFPTRFFSDNSEVQEKVYGAKPYSVMENVILKLQPQASKINYDKDWQSLFQLFPTLTSREFSELSNIKRDEADLLLETLYTEQNLNKLETKNGAVWYKI